MANKMMINNNNERDNDERSGGAEAEMAEEGSGSRSCLGLKKGPWTTSEDAILVEYVRKHGEGNWNAVQKNSGLARCGKSCRLRWANHLRPNLKKGSFSAEEERIIIELHSKIGNKWARMASQLPGRTDNEIKNYWNTRMKRRQRAGLPLYPHDMQQYQNDNGHQRHSSSSSSSSFSPQLLSSSHHHHSPKPTNYSFHHPQSAFHSQPSDSPQLFNGNNRGGFALPITSSVFPFGSSSSSLFNQRTHIPIPQTTLPTPSFQYNVPGSFGCNFGTLSSMVTCPVPYEPAVMGYQVPSSLPVNMVTELPSTQTTPLQSTTPASSYTSGGGGGGSGGGGGGGGEDELDFQEFRGNSGLLDALLIESQTLSRNEAKRKGSPGPALEKAKRFFPENQPAEEEESTVGSESFFKNNSDENARTENFSASCQSSIGVEQREEPLDVNSMDDDLMSLLNNFPTSMPVPDWYGTGGDGSIDRESLGITSGYVRRVEDVAKQDSSPVPPTTGKHDRSLDSCYWNNMPGIC